MNILAIDYGKKRIGLAWVNTDLGVVLPFGVVENQESGIMNQELVELIVTEKVDQIVVGMPIGLDGKENDNTKAVNRFIEALKADVQLPIATVDERFTSAEADRMGGDLHHRQAGATRDEKAAMLMLQSYLGKIK